ncbi:MAG: hypothetical protein QUU85_08865 [Candidatus Eisenbacteria bacterium]|nr:hypothetical protein [Candidatus Eisenbacteria bacterium]
MLERLSRLHEDARPRWGAMSAAQMLAHLADHLELSLGERRGRPLPGPLRRRAIGWLALRLLPIPRATLHSAPGVRPSGQHRGFEAERSRTRVLLLRCVARLPEEDWGESPRFGRLPKRDWGILSFRHFDHHLRQFGV